tara:strand:+ start:49820 stop:50080 length:261 start_codon:yes stop_codon:yes gene_type:complete
MKELNMLEVQSVSGGSCSNNGGYNFSFIVGNALTVGVLSTVFLGGDFVVGAGIGAGYATIMMGAKLADSYFFPVEATKPEMLVELS